MTELGSVRGGRTVFAAGIRFAALSLALFGAVSCKSDGGPTAVQISSLRFVTQPSTVAAGVPFTVSVELLGSNGQRALRAKDIITITAVGGAAVSGPSSLAADDGLATFEGLSVTSAGATVQLSASAGGLSASSAAFSVTPGAPTAAQSVFIQSAASVAPGETSTLTFTFKDAYGNAIASAPVSVSSNLAGATFTPPSGTTSSSGGFETVFRSTAEGTATITATVAGAALEFASKVTVADLCVPGTYTFPGPLNGTLPSGPCLIEGAAANTFRFTVPAAGSGSFVFNPSFHGLLQLTTDPVTPAIWRSVDGGAATVHWLLLPGAHQMRVRALSGSGNYSVTGSFVAGPLHGCEFEQVIVRPGAYAGQVLADGDCFYDPPDDLAYVDIFYFINAAPCTITMRSPTIDTYLTIFNGVNVQAASDGGGPDGFTARVSLARCANPEGGLIGIAATSWGPQDAGTYELIIELSGAAAAGRGSAAATPATDVVIEGLPRGARSSGTISRVLPRRR